MDNLAWIFWAVLGISLIIAEIFTLGFFLFWFGLGALAAAVVGIFGFGFLWQFLAFAIVSMGLTIMSRTIFSDFLWGKGENIKLGSEAMIGQIGTVTTTSKGSLNEAAVRVYGSVWTAYPVDEVSKFEEGQKVEIVSVKGASIYVRSAEKALPGWKDES